MIGSVINSAIIHLCEENVSELFVKPSGDVVASVHEPGVKFRASHKDTSKFWPEDLARFALQLQGHVIECNRCKSEPLGVGALQCFLIKSNK
jgi:hypothetical protein